MKPTAALPMLLLVACSSSPATPPATTPVATVATVAVTDPYEVYLTLPGADPGLSRDDAQLRALLGCGKPFAPGTTDAALAEAYGPLVEEWKRQGMCK